MPVINLPKPGQCAASYPQEPKSPHRRCPACGRFLRWNDYYGCYQDHLSYDGESWEWTCR